MLVLDQTHLVQQRTGIALLRGAEHAKARAGAHLAQPAFDLFGQALVGGEGNQTRSRFSSRRGRRESISSLEKA
jgi:hypothetical protein